MKMKLLAALCFITTLCKGQSVAYFEIGKPSPDFTLNEVVNYSASKVSLKDFAGKWAVLYFWNFDLCADNWCEKNMLPVDNLSKKFKKNIQFMMIGYTGSQYRSVGSMDKGMRETYAYVKNQGVIHIPMAYDSSLFHHSDIGPCPFIVMIDPKGIVRSVTSAITENDITAVMKGQKSSSPYAYRTHEPGSAYEYYRNKKYLQVGHPFENYIFKDVKYFPKTTVTRNDFPGKWLVIDCWSTHCPSCIASFPFVDSMQRKYADKLQYLSVGFSGGIDLPTQRPEDDKIKSLYEKLQKKENLSFPVAFDSLFFYQNDVGGVPWIIVIDPSGIVRGITHMLTEQNLIDYFEGRDPVLPKVYRKHEDGYQKMKIPSSVETIYEPSAPSQNISKIHVDVMDNQIKKVFLFRGVNQHEFNVVNNSADLTDTLERPELVNLVVTYKDYKPARNMYTLYLTPGTTNVKISKGNNSMEQLYVDGPKLSVEYTNILEKPVFKYGLQLDSLRSLLEEPGADSAKINEKITPVMKASFNVARNYIKKHPSSPLSIVALQMMGSGDPTIKDPEKELADLYHSLSGEVQNSFDGKKYGQRF